MGSALDAVVVGGGIVGLATARALLLDRPGSAVVVLEKESAPALHQSGRNSGVIHSGIYYPPGSLKALLCAAGRRSMEAYARDHGIPVEITGKLIVATRIEEIDRLDALAERGRAHGLTVRPMSPAEAAEVEPHIGCVAALHVAETGVVDFPAVCAQLARDVVELGGEVRTGCRVTAMATVPGGQRVTTTSGEIRTRRLVNCGGLQSDLLAAAAGVEVPGRIIAFRGEYRDLVASARPLVRGLIYPVPDPRFPFLGVHLTRGVDGGVHAGPNAVLALAREGYRWSDVDIGETVGTLRSPAFRHLARRHFRDGIGEVVRSLSERRFLAELQRLVPDLRAEHLQPAPSGVRAQAVLDDGTLVDDFLLVSEPGALHVLNAPSPAATASLEIGAEIARRLTTP